MGSPPAAVKTIEKTRRLLRSLGNASLAMFYK
jgi:hypothetical protein